MISHFCHIFCHAPQNNLEGALHKFERAGFIISPRRARHPAGHWNGFISLTRSYLELISIIDEAEYDREADASERYFREHPRPYGIGAMTADSKLVHQGLTHVHPHAPPPYSRGETNSTDSKPIWTFIELPPESTPGATVFTTQYHNLAPPQFQYGKNQIYALGGFWYCSEEPEAAFKSWSKTLTATADRFEAKIQVTAPLSKFSAQLRFQELHWISPQDYKEHFSREWQPAPVPFGDVAAALLYTSDLNASELCMRDGGFTLVQAKNGYAFFAPDPETGYTFILKEVEPEWVTKKIRF
jgi:hypothetical protein